MRKNQPVYFSVRFLDFSALADGGLPFAESRSFNDDTSVVFEKLVASVDAFWGSFWISAAAGCVNSD